MLLPRAIRLATPKSISRFYSTTTTTTTAKELSKTPLYDLHVARGAKMVPFAGYSMPVTYSDQSVGESHNWVRKRAGMFDVSHMVQHLYSPPQKNQIITISGSRVANTLQD
jgi:aminomethyltransferase